PMVFIANYWTPNSTPVVRVFSNCEEITLLLNGELVGKRRPDSDRLSTNVAHPPFTFDLGRFRPGTLEAIGHIGDREVARHVVETPGEAERLDLRVDESGRRFAAGGKDVIFVRAEIKDGAGTTVSDAWENVSFGATGDLNLLGANPFSSEAGIASTLVETRVGRPRGAVYALSLIGDGEIIRVLSAGVSLGSGVEPFEVRVTSDGSQPEPNSALYVEPVEPTELLRAAIFVRGRPVAQADWNTVKFRIAGSVAPEQR
ncbi:MAG: DUF4982 domain-containing protein, partial [Gemmatimonadota bacterium]|nr:DUF4982 domain-containing protein [Gemmatimonadota bacterium]